MHFLCAQIADSFCICCSGQLLPPPEFQLYSLSFFAFPAPCPCHVQTVMLSARSAHIQNLKSCHIKAFRFYPAGSLESNELCPKTLGINVQLCSMHTIERFVATICEDLHRTLTKFLFTSRPIYCRLTCGRGLPPPKQQQLFSILDMTLEMGLQCRGSGSVVGSGSASLRSFCSDAPLSYSWTPSGKASVQSYDTRHKSQRTAVQNNSCLEFIFDNTLRTH